MLPTFSKRRQSGNQSLQTSPEKGASKPDPYWRKISNTGRYEGSHGSKGQDASFEPLIGHQFPFQMQLLNGTPKKENIEDQLRSAVRSPSQEAFMDRQLSVNSSSDPKTSSIRLRVSRQSIEKSLLQKMALNSSQVDSLAVFSDFSINLVGTTEEQEDALSGAVADIVVRIVTALQQSGGPLRGQLNSWGSHEDVASLASTKEAYSVQDDGQRRESPEDVWPSAGTVHQIARAFAHSSASNDTSNAGSPTGTSRIPKVLDIQQGMCPHCGLKGSKERVAALGSHHGAGCILARNYPGTSEPPTTTAPRHPKPASTATRANPLSTFHHPQGGSTSPSPAVSPTKPNAFHHPTHVQGLQDTSSSPPHVALEEPKLAQVYGHRAHAVEIPARAFTTSRLPQHEQPSRAEIHGERGDGRGGWSEAASAAANAEPAPSDRPYALKAAASTRQEHLARMAAACAGPAPLRRPVADPRAPPRTQQPQPYLSTSQYGHSASPSTTQYGHSDYPSTTQYDHSDYPSTAQYGHSDYPSTAQYGHSDYPSTQYGHSDYPSTTQSGLRTPRQYGQRRVQVQIPMQQAQAWPSIHDLMF